MVSIILSVFSAAAWLFGAALLLALVEIEIEGRFGWAEKIPTWYRTTGVCGKAWGLFLAGKPLTGYHLFLNALLLLLLHSGFFILGAAWSVRDEMLLVAKFFVFAAFWDFLWFVFNPFYGLRNYKKTTVWWFSKSRWLFGLFPLDYAVGIGMSLIPAYFVGELKQQLTLIGLLLAMTSVAVVLSPLYHRWYGWMREHDDRERAGIFHTDLQ